MIEIQYIVAFSAAIVNLFKKSLRADVVPLCTIFVSVVLNLINALIFGGDLSLAGGDAFIAAGVAVALFTTGDAVRTCELTPFKCERTPEEKKIDKAQAD